ncbi:leucine-rich repeat domain-containing protein [Treponema sp. OMZ 305]|uniref:leucine-rich repeat domain-containing protein n=1 Tax=Treponema sp. OMZ 305 TaxID=1659192 RepID=UPI0020A3ACEB|nr:leucine-rich repeat domain-containing protein [Treponema sp. OMZ 305]UTC57913.1 leucine-rich repeat domain-containing protein [Treponema sp. OMZ 305]
MKTKLWSIGLILLICCLSSCYPPFSVPVDVEYADIIIELDTKAKGIAVFADTVSGRPAHLIGARTHTADKMEELPPFSERDKGGSIIALNQERIGIVGDITQIEIRGLFLFTGPPTTITGLVFKNGKHIKTLICAPHEFTAMPHFSALTELEYLELSGMVYTLSPQNRTLDLSNNKKLKVLSAKTTFESIVLPDSPYLQKLDISVTKNESFNLSRYPNLEELSLRCKTSVDLSGNPKLRIVQLSGATNDTLNLLQNPHLEQLSIYGEQLHSLNLLQNPRLEQLSIHGKQLHSLILPQLSHLKYLDISGCTLLTALDTSAMPKLEKLDCSRNSLTSLDVSNNLFLHNLYCASNANEDGEGGIKTLILGNLPELKILNCRRNNLNVLDIEGCPHLEILNCSYNNLQTLDVSKQRELEGLFCAWNRLKILDVRTCQILNDMTCSYNALTDIKIDPHNLSKAPFGIITLDIKKNRLTRATLDALLYSLPKKNAASYCEVIYQADKNKPDAYPYENEEPSIEARITATENNWTIIKR